MIFKGTLNSDQIKEAICSSFIKDSTPDNCFPHGTLDYKTEYYIIILIVLVILTGFFFCMIFGYKSMVKKEMSKEMNI
jgi:hypothetical protein